MKKCPLCKGTGKAQSGNTCPACDGNPIITQVRYNQILQIKKQVNRAPKRKTF